MRAKNGGGSVSLDKRSGQWFFYYYEDGKRKNKRIGTRDQYPTKQSAWRAAQPLRAAVETCAPVPLKSKMSVSVLVDRYRATRMPERLTTRRGYEAWLRNHIIPQWGNSPITALQPEPVDVWLKSLPLSPKSRVHIRNLLSVLIDFAMFCQVIPIARNPMELVTVTGATKHVKPRSLTVEEFRAFLVELEQPFDVVALLCANLGLRISECLALRWSDVDWLSGRLKVERGIVRQVVDVTKTDTSRKTVSLDGILLRALEGWRKYSQFVDAEDWIFASPVQLGAVPWSYPWCWVQFQRAAAASGLGKLGTHSLRHSYRSWLDQVGTPMSVQQKLMRHADIKTTMNTYGDVVTDQEAQANSKIANLLRR